MREIGGRLGGKFNCERPFKVRFGMFMVQMYVKR